MALRYSSVTLSPVRLSRQKHSYSILWLGVYGFAMAEHALRSQVEYRLTGPHLAQELISLRVHNHSVKKGKDGAEDVKLSNRPEHTIAKSARGTLE